MDTTRDFSSPPHALFRYVVTPDAIRMERNRGSTSGTRHQVVACIALGRPLTVRASLLGQGVEWLDAPHS
jgi:hypothetical protein